MPRRCETIAMDNRSDCKKRSDIQNLEKAWSKIRNAVDLICPECGTTFTRRPSEIKRSKSPCCSWECRCKHFRGDLGPNAGGGEHMRGAANPNWKGGGATERARLHKRDPLVANWRRRVYARDKYTCRKCGFQPKEKRQLNAHHIKPWADYPEFRFEVSNGVTLCVACHRNAHRKN